MGFFIALNNRAFGIDPEHTNRQYIQNPLRYLQDTVTYFQCLGSLLDQPFDADNPDLHTLEGA